MGKDLVSTHICTVSSCSQSIWSASVTHQSNKDDSVEICCICAGTPKTLENQKRTLMKINFFSTSGLFHQMNEEMKRYSWSIFKFLTFNRRLNEVVIIAPENSSEDFINSIRFEVNGEVKLPQRIQEKEDITKVDFPSKLVVSHYFSFLSDFFFVAY
jgi:hypothetical protein